MEWGASSRWRATAPSGGSGRGGASASRGNTFSIRPYARGAACADPACRSFHHGGALCRFFPNCTPPTGRRCPFRHPATTEVSSTQRDPRPSPSNAASRTATAPPPTPAKAPVECATGPSVAPASAETCMPVSERLAAVQAMHQHTLDDAVSELWRLDSVLGSSDAESRAIKFALRGKLNELEQQEMVFCEVTRRIEMRTELSPADKNDCLAREITRFLTRRAIDAVRLEIERELQSAAVRFLAVKSADGCGASVRIPQYACELTWPAPSHVMCVQPTKAKAELLAAQISHELGGDSSSVSVSVKGADAVAIQVPQRSSRSGTVEVVPTFDMLALLERSRQASELDNPLQDIRFVVVGDAQRSDPTNEKIVRTLSEDHPHWRNIKVVVVVSPIAPLDVGSFSRQLQGAPIVRVTRCNFPVEIKYQPFPKPRTGAASFVDPALLPLVAARFVLRVVETLAPGDGDVVCFLPSRADVSQAKWFFEREISARNSSLVVLAYELFAGQDPVECVRRLDHATQLNRVVFSTGELDFDTAMEAVACVVDTGLQYAVVGHHADSSASLQVQPIEQSRALRLMRLAGRTSPGKCFRLYAAHDFDNMPVDREKCSLDEPSEHSNWFDDDNGSISRVLEVTRLTDPRHARMLTYAASRGFTLAGIDLVAVLLVANDCFEAQRLKNIFWNSCIEGEGDVIALYRIFSEWKTVAATQGEGWDASRIWCKDRGINVVAMRLAHDLSLRLRLLFQYELAYLTSADGTPTDKATTRQVLSRIVAAGFIMNAAISKPPVQGREYLALQYLSIRTGEHGSLSSVAALSLRISTTSASRDSLPTWIVFCCEHRTQDGPTFSLVVPIEEAWIAESSTVLAGLYDTKRDDLPVGSCEWQNLSAELVNHVFGTDGGEANQSPKVRAIEKLLSCKVHANALMGRVVATGFPPRESTIVHSKMNTLFDETRESLEQRTIEAHYMGATRAIIGRGFQVKELLFADEFASLTMCGWEGGGVAEISALLQRVSIRAGLGYKNESIIRHVDASDPTKPIVHLDSKSIARQALDALWASRECKGLTIVPELPTETPAPDTMRTQFAGRIKVTWADGHATRSGKVYFASAADANTFLRGYERTAAFCAIEVTAFGVLPTAGFEPFRARREIDSSSPELPPLVREYVGYSSKRVVFDEDAIQRMPMETTEKFKFCVRIRSGLSPSIDEEELIKLLQPARVAHCRIDRAGGTSKNAVREARLVSHRVNALASMLVPPEESVEWNDKIAHRAGVSVYFQDLRRLDQVIQALDQSNAWRHNGAKGPYGQPVRRCVEFTYRTSFVEGLYECFRSKFTPILEQARQKGVWQPETQPQRLPDGQVIIVLKFVSRDRKILQELADSLEGVLECDKADGMEFEVLFTLAGSLKAQEWLQTHRESTAAKVTWIKQDIKTRSFWIYGASDDRIKTMTSLRQLAATIHGQVEVLDKIVRLDLSTFSARNPIAVKQWLAAQPGAKALYHFTVLGDGSRVSLSGSKHHINELLVEWAEEGKLLVRDPAAIASSTARRECGVCMLPADDPVVQFAVCGHSFCLECIQPGITPTSRLPLMCPALECGRFISVQDVAKVSNDFGVLVETAVFDYVARHPSECVVCPKPGCNQILSRDTVQANKFVSCACCAKSYCLECSAATGQAMEQHDTKLSCDDFQARGGAEADRHVRHVRDRILTLRCPQCGAAFLDFDGCMCVCCGNATCNYHFCSNCLAFSARDEQEAHRHVRTCPKNPLPGQYFVPSEKREQLHRELRRTQLVAYLTSQIPTQRLRRAVLDRVTRDLADLGIAISARDVDAQARLVTQPQ